MPSPPLNRRRRALLVLIFLGMVCLALPRGAQEAARRAALAVLSPVLSPLQGASSGLKRWIGRGLGLGPDPALEAGIKDLQARVAQREQEIGALRRQVQGMGELQGLGLGRPLAARVIGRDPQRWRNSLMLDKGRADRVRTGQVVACGIRLVGRVGSVSEDACQVQCLTDPDTRIWVAVGKGDPGKPDGGRVQAVAQGRGDGLVLILCAKPVAAEDAVMTSGYDERYPPGLLAGKVAEVKGTGESAVVLIAPACDLDNLEEVQILIPPEAPSR